MTPENERESATDGGARTDDADAARAAGERAAGTTATESLAPEAMRGGPDGSWERAADGPEGEADDEAVVSGAEEAEGSGEPSLEERLVAAESLAAAHWDRLVRLQAEMENQRKRAQRDVGNARKFALEGIAEDLLPVKDSLELGLRAASADEASVASLLQGSELTLKMLSGVLEKHAIAEIDPEGEKFDPEFHQAMSMQEAEGVPPNTVTGVMQKGYTLNDRLIRPALVMVSK